MHYTHVGMKGLAARESLDIDPVLNRNRKWHACTHVAGDAYKTLCGVHLLAVDPEESGWGARVGPKDTHRVTCRRCTKRLESAAATMAAPSDHYCHHPWHFHPTKESRNHCVDYGPKIATQG